MDYFGISSPDFQKKVDIQREKFGFSPDFNKTADMFRNIEKFEFSNDGFGCQTPNCKNREAKYGLVILPHCNDNEICLRKNLEFLISENLHCKGEINAYEKILNNNIEYDKKMDISPKRKREESIIRKNIIPNPKRLTYSI